MSGQEASQSVPGKPRRLGRGLSSLIDVRTPVAVHVGVDSPPAAPPQDTAVQSSGSEHLHFLELSSIIPNKFQPRKGFDEVALLQLAESIKHSGLMQPVIVRKTSGGAGSFELIAGERRWRAAKMAGLTSIPALVRDLSDEESAEWAIVENVQREDLNPMERAWAFRSLTDRFGLSQGQIAERAGLERSSVANFVRLTELEPTIQDMISAGRLNLGHGKALLAVSPGESRISLATEAAREGWSVRRLERAASTIANGAGSAASAPAKARSASLDDLERRLGEYLGTKVSIVSDRGGKRGRLVIEFYGLDHFDGLMNRVGFQAS